MADRKIRTKEIKTNQKKKFTKITSNPLNEERFEICTVENRFRFPLSTNVQCCY